MDKENNFDTIKRHMLDPDGDGIVLNDIQQQMMERWNAVIELKSCQNLSDNAIVQKLMDSFFISRMTAYNDIGNAEALFGYSVPLNIRYRIGARIKFCEDMIRDLIKKKKYLVAAHYEKNLVNYYKQYPELKTPAGVHSLTFTYNDEKPLLDNPPSIEDAEFVLMEAAKESA